MDSLEILLLLSPVALLAGVGISLAFRRLEPARRVPARMFFLGFMSGGITSTLTLIWLRSGF